MGKKAGRKFLRLGATHRELIEVPAPLFSRLVADRLFQPHPRKPHVATVNPLLCCWVEAVSSESTLPVEHRLRFRLRESPVHDRFALRSSFFLLTRLWIMTVQYKRRDGVSEPQYTILWDWHEQTYAT